MEKVYILDTNILIDDPEILNGGDEKTTYIIPMIVIEELDNLKKRSGIEGRNARYSVRILDGYKEYGFLLNGVFNTNGAEIKVVDSDTDITKPDNIILDVANKINIELGEVTKVVLLSNDLNVRVKAQSKGIIAQEHLTDKKYIDHFDGYKEMYVSPNVIDMAHQGKLLLSDLPESLMPNEYVKLISWESASSTFIGRYNESTKRVVKLNDNLIASRIKPKNMEQKFLMDALLNDDIKLITISGTSGCGKTFIALAVGLQKIRDGMYDKIMISKSMTAVGEEELGFLPGDMDEKLMPWMANYTDNLEQLTQNHEEMIEEGQIELLPLTYLRGRNIDNAYIILSEAQNLTVDGIKTLLTRAGKNTKIILEGDYEQRDNRRLDEFNNGLSIAIDAFKEYACHAHITLKDGTLRSELAHLASQIL